jgi:hypothetical protein
VIFDKLCGIAERHLPPLRRVLDRCALFRFPGYAHEVLPGRFSEMDEEEIRFLWDEFRMPFPYMAVEDANSVVLLWEEREDAHGLATQRSVLECVRMSEEWALKTADPEPLAKKVLDGARRLHARFGDFYLVTAGHIQGESLDDVATFGATFRAECRLALTANKESVIQSADKLLRPPMDRIGSESLVRNGRAALEEIMWFNSPSRFVVKDTPTKRRKVSKGKVARSDQRSTYTLLTPVEIRDQLGMGAGASSTGKMKQGHERRGHWRRYRSDRFSESVRSKPRWIKAMWVGDTEVTKGKHRYEVLLDV